MGVSSQQEQPVEDDTVPATGTTLLLSSSIGTGERTTCLDLLSQSGFEATKAVHVLYMESGSERYRQIERYCHGHPEETAVIAVGSGGIVGERGPDPPGDYYVKTLADAADLTGLGMALNDCLTEWEETGTELVCCFDSLSILLQYADTERVFRFLHMLTGKLSDVGATAHFHMDPVAHDEETVAKLSQVFDSIVELDEAGVCTIKR